MIKKISYAIIFGSLNIFGSATQNSCATKSTITTAALSAPVQESQEGQKLLDIVTHDAHIQDIITGYADHWYRIKTLPIKNFPDAAANNLHFLPGIPVLVFTDLATKTSNNADDIPAQPELEQIIRTYRIEENCTTPKQTPNITVVKPVSPLQIAGRTFYTLGKKILPHGKFRTMEEPGLISKDMPVVEYTHTGMRDLSSLFYIRQHDLVITCSNNLKLGGSIIMRAKPSEQLTGVLSRYLPATITALILEYENYDHFLENFWVKSGITAAATNNKYLVTGDALGYLYAYNLATLSRVWPTIIFTSSSQSAEPKKNKQKITKHTGPIYALTIGNNQIFSASDDGTVKSWDLHTGKFIRQITQLQKKDLKELESVTSLAVSSDGRYMAIGSADGSIELWANLGARLKKYSQK